MGECTNNTCPYFVSGVFRGDGETSCTGTIPLRTEKGYVGSRKMAAMAASMLQKLDTSVVVEPRQWQKDQKRAIVEKAQGLTQRHCRKRDYVLRNALKKFLNSTDHV